MVQEPDRGEKKKSAISLIEPFIYVGLPNLTLVPDKPAITIALIIQYVLYYGQL